MEPNTAQFLDCSLCRRASTRRPPAHRICRHGTCTSCGQSTTSPRYASRPFAECGGAASINAGGCTTVTNRHQATSWARYAVKLRATCGCRSAARGGDAYGGRCQAARAPPSSACRHTLPLGTRTHAHTHARTSLHIRASCTSVGFSLCSTAGTGCTGLGLGFAAFAL
jgi:hypothetical protein